MSGSKGSERRLFRRIGGQSSVSGLQSPGADDGRLSSSRSVDSQQSPGGGRRRSNESQNSAIRKEKRSLLRKMTKSKRTQETGQDDSESLDTPIPRPRSRELLDAFLEQIEKDLQKNDAIGSSALKQLHDIKAQLAADEDNDAALLESTGSMSGALIECSIPSEDPLSNKQSSGESGETARTSNRHSSRKLGKADSARTNGGETVPTTVDASEDVHGELSSTSDELSETSDLSGLTGVFSSRPASAATDRAQASSSKDDPPRPKKEPGRSSRRKTLDSTDAILANSKEGEKRVETSTTGRNMGKDETSAEGKRAVSFQSVFVRSYERILENNPSCTSGPSIGIGWNYEMEQEFFIEDFERVRLKERRNDLVLSRDEREDMLLDLGYTERELANAVRSMIKEKNKRRQTVQNLGASGVEEIAETAKRRVRKILSIRKRSNP